MRAVGIFPRLNIVCRLQSKSRKQGISAAATVCRSKWQPVWCAYSSKEHPPGAIPRRMLCRHLWRRSPRSGGGRACLLCTQVCTAARYTSVPAPIGQMHGCKGHRHKCRKFPSKMGKSIVAACCNTIPRSGGAQPLFSPLPRRFATSGKKFDIQAFWHKRSTFHRCALMPFWHSIFVISRSGVRIRPPAPKGKTAVLQGLSLIHI